MPKNKVSVSFSGKYIHLYEFLKTKDNVSNYICSLIEKDLEKPHSDDEILEAKIEEVVERILRNKNINYISTNTPSGYSELSEITKVSQEDVNTILGLF